MQFWTLVSENCWKILMILVVGLSISGLGNPSPSEAADPWQWQPWISVSSGHESDLVLDPELTRTIVPGGYFVELAPGFRLSKRISPTVGFRLLNRTSWERFANDDNRTLFGSQLFGEFQYAGNSILRGRIAFIGDYFNDSGASTFRRYSGGGEAGIGFETSRWNLELTGFLQGRSYPNVAVLVNEASTQNYSENHQGISGSATWHPFSSLFLRGQISGRNTDSLDPAFVSKSVTATGSAEVRLGRRAWCSASLTSQSRDFTNRISSTDHDSYYQYGVGLGYNVSRQVSLVGRYAFADYTYPLGENENTQRISLAATWQFGKKAPLISRTRFGSPGLVPMSVWRQSPVLVKVYAPEAKQVQVAGSFNHWNPASHPMHKNSEGWWELQLELSPGIHRYVYLIDGKSVTPSDADRLVDDGFGGQNGILQIVKTNR